MGKKNKERRAQKRRDKARKRKRERQARERKPPASPLSLREFQNPFRDLSESERDEARRAIAEKSEANYRESLEKLVSLLHRYEPAMLLSIVASYALSVPVGDKGVQKSDSEFTLYQSHIEILQALMLQIDPAKMQREPVGPAIVQEAIDALKSLMQSLSFRGFAPTEDGQTDHERAVQYIQRWMRGNTQMVRNWGFFSQHRTVGGELYAPCDDALVRTFGFSSANVLEVFQSLIDRVERRLTERFEMLSELARLKDKRQLVEEYHRRLELPAEQAQEFLDNINVSSIAREMLFMMLMSHLDLRLPEIFTFSSQEVANHTHIPREVAQEILSTFSMRFGDLSGYPADHLFLSNPVWQQPIIRLGDDRFICTIPQVFFTFIIPALGRLVNQIDSALLGDRRSRYLEEKIREITLRRFPTASTVSKIKWSIGETEYETDLITCIDSHLLIIEAKSGTITEPALRGAPDRLKKHVEDVLVAPNLQSKRLKSRLEELIADPTVQDDLRNKVPVDLATINRVIRVSVSLADVGSLQANVVSQLQATGWLPKDYEACPTMTLADFETLFDFLEHPVQILHYLERRQELEAVVRYVGDELDLMGLYVDTLFNLGDIDPKMELYISGMSKKLDAYYNSKDAGIKIAKPQPRISTLFAAILAQLESQKTPRWTEIGIILNRFSPEDQRQLTRMIRKLKENVRKRWMISNHENMAICIPSVASEFALAYIVFNDKTAGRRDDFVNGACRTALEPVHVKQCIAIAKNMDRNERAYDFIALVQ